MENKFKLKSLDSEICDLSFEEEANNAENGYHEMIPTYNNNNENR